MQNQFNYPRGKYTKSGVKQPVLAAKKAKKGQTVFKNYGANSSSSVESSKGSSHHGKKLGVGPAKKPIVQDPEYSMFANHLPISNGQSHLNSYKSPSTEAPRKTAKKLRTVETSSKQMV